MALQFRRSGNPGLNQNTFARVPRVGFGQPAMTLAGTINKSFLLLVVMMVCALWPWAQMSAGNAQAVNGLVTLGAIGGFVLAMIISFKPTTAPYLSIPYAALEGVVLGAVSALFERRYPGIAIEAIGGTFAVSLVMLVLYRTGVIRVTNRLRAVVMGAMIGIVVLFVASWILSFFHVMVPFVYGTGALGLGGGGSSTLAIGFSALVIIVAAFMLTLDFDMIERGVAGGAPRYMEWYGAFGLMLTLVWMYIEMLRLMAQLRE